MSHHTPRSELKRYSPNRSLTNATVQNLWVDLLLKHSFNGFEQQQILHDLYAQPDLWQQFWLGWLMFEVEFYQRTQAAPILQLLKMLIYAENKPQHRNDVLYIQTVDVAGVPALVELAE